MACWKGDRTVQRIKKQINNYNLFINCLEGKSFLIFFDYKVLIISEMLMKYLIYKSEEEEKRLKALAEYRILGTKPWSLR